jgi:hypothetical protein
MKTAMQLAYQHQKRGSMSTFPEDFPNKTAIRLTDAGLDLYRAARMSDEELLKIEGIGRSTVATIRKFTPSVQYNEILTPDLVQGYILVIDVEQHKKADPAHLVSLIFAARGFALSKDGKVGITRRIS